MASAMSSDLRGAQQPPPHTPTADDGAVKPATTDDGAVKPATSHPSFFDLPAELRLEIYEYAFAYHMKTCQQRLEARAHKHAGQLDAVQPGLGRLILPCIPPTGPLPPFLLLRHPLLRANKTIYSEALPLHLEALHTYLKATTTAERENLELSGIPYADAVTLSYDDLDTQYEFNTVFQWEIRSVLENCSWWTLRDENDRISSELDCWFEHVEWVDSGDITDPWREDKIHRAGLRLYPIVQGMYNWVARSGPRDHPKEY